MIAAVFTVTAVLAAGRLPLGQQKKDSGEEGTDEEAVEEGKEDVASLAQYVWLRQQNSARKHA